MTNNILENQIKKFVSNKVVKSRNTLSEAFNFSQTRRRLTHPN